MKIFLSPLAAQKIEALLEYLEKDWSTKVTEEFLSKLKRKFNQISRQPKSCIQSKLFPDIYKCVVTKQTSFYYRIKNDEIEIISLMDNRQDPNTVYGELKKYFC